MGKKDEKEAEAQPIDRDTAKAVLKLRAEELKWDPDHLREFLADLVDML